MNQVTSGMSSVDAPPAELDITRETCPMTLVRTRIALDRLPVGALLLIRMEGIEPTLEVPRAVAELGHDVIRLTIGEEQAALLVRKR